MERKERVQRCMPVVRYVLECQGVDALLFVQREPKLIVRFVAARSGVFLCGDRGY